MQMIELYQRGYGKDAAGIAAEAINYGINLNKSFFCLRFCF
jgi:hypothetical protein